MRLNISSLLGQGIFYKIYLLIVRIKVKPIYLTRDKSVNKRPSSISYDHKKNPA